MISTKATSSDKPIPADDGILKEKEVTVYGIRLSYYENKYIARKTTNRANTPCIVFLHCWCSNKASFKEQMIKISNQYACLSIDLPGHGQSSKPQLTYTIVLMAEVIIGLLQKLDLSNVILVGHGLGSAVALEARCQAPSFFSGLALLSPAPLEKTSKLYNDVVNSLKHIKKNGFRSFCQKNFYPIFFGEGGSSALENQAVKATTKVPEYVGFTSLESVTDWTGKSAARAIGDLPLCLVLTNNTLSDLAIWQKTVPHLYWSKPLKAPHYCHQISPREVHHTLLSFIEDVTTKKQ